MDVETTSLDETIIYGHDVLQKIIQRDFKIVHSRFVQDQGCMVAMQQLILALGTAQAKRDTLSSAVAANSAPAGQEDVDIAHKDLLKAIRHIESLIANLLGANDTDQAIFAKMASDAATEALEICFRATPFQITVNNVKGLISQDVSFQYDGSPLASLARYHVSATPVTTQMMPCFQNLVPTVNEWMTAQTTDIYQVILSDYMPLPRQLHRVQWVQKNSNLINIATGFRGVQRKRYENLIVKTVRIGILGLCGLGKSTMINALIGEDILTTNNGDWKTKSSLSAGWPIIIRHERNAQVPRLSIDPTNFISIIRILREELFDHSETLLEEPLVVAIWDEYQESQSSSSVMRHLKFEGVDSIKEVLHVIGKIVRAFTPLTREDKDFQFSSSWPVIEVCMATFCDVEHPLEFLDLPGIGNRTLIARDIEAQWKTSFDSCDAYIYTVKADLELLDAERLELNLDYLAVSMTYKGSPWLVVATHSDLVTKSPDERPIVIEELKNGFQSIIGGRGVVPFDVEVVLCSPAMHLSARKVQRVLEQSSGPYSWEEIESAGGLAVLMALGEGINLSELPHHIFSGYLERILHRSSMGNVSSMIAEKLLPQSLSLITKAAMSTTKDDLWCIHTGLHDVLTWGIISNDALEKQRRLSFDYFQKAATFCASWSVKLLENQREWHRSVDFYLMNLRQTLQDELDGLWSRMLKAYGLRKPDSAFFDSDPIKSIKALEMKAEIAHSRCEVRVKKLAASVWEKCLGELLEHLALDVFNGVEDGYQGLQRRVFDDIEAIRRQSCEKVISGLIRKVGKRIGLETSEPTDAFWRAHEGARRRKDMDGSFIEDSLHLLTDLPRDHNQWSRTPPISTTLERVSYLEQWKKHTEIVANGLEAVGFLVLPPLTPPRFSTTDIPYGRGMSSKSLKPQLEKIQDIWYESMRQQSLRTIEGALRAVSFIGIRAVLDVFIDQIQNLEVNKIAQAVSQRMSVTETEEIIVAESNAVCAWAALDKLTQIDDLDIPEE